MTEATSAYFIVAWVVAMIAAFPYMLPHRAILLIYFSGSLFLPEVSQGVLGFGPIKFYKLLAISYAALLAALIYDSANLLARRPTWSDLPILALFAWVTVSAMVNDPPPDGSSQVRDAFAQTFATSVVLGIPYLMGRVYFSRGDALRDFAFAFLIAGLVYAPFCLWEIRFSPQLNRIVFGFTQHSFAQTIRFNGYRPMVFMQHGLAVGMLISMAAMQSVWLRRTLSIKAYVPYVLVPLTVLCKSTGAFVLGFVGLAVLFASRHLRTRALLLALTLLPVAYASTRTSGLWTGRFMTELAKEYLNDDRAGSIEFRLINEDLLIQKALRHPWAGWGGWGRGHVYDENGKDITITDGLWIIILGDRGIVGLSLFAIVVIGPAVRFACRFDPSTWHTPAMAPAAGLAVALSLWSIDNLFNGMDLPFFILLAGALTRWEPDSPQTPAHYDPHYVPR